MLKHDARGDVMPNTNSLAAPLYLRMNFFLAVRPFANDSRRFLACYWVVVCYHTRLAWMLMTRIDV